MQHSKEKIGALVIHGFGDSPSYMDDPLAKQQFERWLARRLGKPASENVSVAMQRQLVEEYWSSVGAPSAQLVRADWHDKQFSWQHTYSFLEYHANQLKQHYHQLVAVGISAGAGAAALLYLNEVADYWVNVAGWVQTPSELHSRLIDEIKPRSPKFVEMLRQLEPRWRTLTPKQKKRMRVLRPVFDTTVPPETTTPEGVEEVILPVPLHFPGILYALYNPHLIFGVTRQKQPYSAI